MIEQTTPCLKWITHHFPHHKTIVDVGGCAGANMAYLTNHLSYERYVAFETHYSDYENLIRALGDCRKVHVSLYHSELSDRFTDSSRTMDSYGFQHLTLMTLNTPDPVRVLKGGLVTLQDQRPLLLVTMRSERQRDQVFNYLARLNYTEGPEVPTFCGPAYVYLP